MPLSSAGSWQLDASDPGAIARYLVERRLIAPQDEPIVVDGAGAGNMNVVLRVTPARGRALIVKQGRPWVAKYPQIPAPLERTAVEAAFYEEIARAPGVARMMPTVLHADPDHHVLVLEDVGTQGDFTPVYGGAMLEESAVNKLLDWLERLQSVRVPGERRAVFANRAMRALNHEHIFDFPLRRDNGLDLDAITPGLQAAARELQDDRAYCEAVTAAGRHYLADGDTLVHGDFFPGSWLHAGDDVRVIDPEFCFLGDAAFDYGVALAHAELAGAAPGPLRAIGHAVERRGVDWARVLEYSGIEIMRRLIGVAQLPLNADLARKRAWLRSSHRSVTGLPKGSAS
jgi:5-methylthioribose kinase